MNKGFTLSEALVTMGIIGVLAAVIMPSTVAMRPNNELVKFRKAYYLAEKTISELVNDEELYPMAYSKGLGDVSEVEASDGTKYKDSAKFCNLFALKMNLSSDVACNANAYSNDKITFTTTDGIDWYIPVHKFSNAPDMSTIVVDVNGEAAPNCMFTNSTSTCTSPDRFQINFYRDGRISVPANGMEQEYLKRSKISKGAKNETKVDAKKMSAVKIEDPSK